MLQDDDVIRSYNSDVLQSYLKQGNTVEIQMESKMSLDMSETNDVVAANSINPEPVLQTEWVKMSNAKGAKVDLFIDTGTTE